MGCNEYVNELNWMREWVEMNAWISLSDAGLEILPLLAVFHVFLWMAGSAGKSDPVLRGVQEQDHILARIKSLSLL